MSVKLVCRCGNTYTVDERRLHDSYRCPVCGKPLQVEAQAEPTEPRRLEEDTPLESETDL